MAVNTYCDECCRHGLHAYYCSRERGLHGVLPPPAPTADLLTTLLIDTLEPESISRLSLQRLLRALDRVEWRGTSGFPWHVAACPFCNAEPDVAPQDTPVESCFGLHATDCEWAALQEEFKDVQR